MALVRKWVITARYALPVAPGETVVEETEEIGEFDYTDLAGMFGQLVLMYRMFEAIARSFEDRSPYQGYSPFGLHVEISVRRKEVPDA